MLKPRRSKLSSIVSRVAHRLDDLLALNVLDLSAVRSDAIATLPSAHAVYAFVQHQLSVIAEVLAQLEELDRISNVISRAREAYMPRGLPMSPLTRSYFDAWAFFDCGVGVERETLGTIVLDLHRRLRMHEAFVSVLEKWEASRMGLFELEDATEHRVRLRELVTDRRIEAANPSGCRRTPGSVWYLRVLPPPTPRYRDHVIVTTPYEVTAPRALAWITFLERTLPKTKIVDERRAYEHLMKWGLSHDYWHEYVHKAYADEDPRGIRLMGLPACRVQIGARDARRASRPTRATAHR